MRFSTLWHSIRMVYAWDDFRPDAVHAGIARWTPQPVAIKRPFIGAELAEKLLKSKAKPWPSWRCAA